MAKRPIIKLFDPLLKTTSAPVERVDSALVKLADEMFETMYDAKGIGLAAIQIGVPRRLFVLDVAEDGESADPRVFINPRITAVSDERSTMYEGCLSIPDVLAEVERPAEILVNYIDLDGKEQECRASGLLATCIQHEFDHLEGRLFIDHLSRIKRMMAVKQYEKLSRRSSL